MTTPGEARWKEMVAQLALRTGMTPLDVEAATEGRIKAAEVSALMAQRAQASGSEDRTPPVADGAPPDDAEPAGTADRDSD